VKGLVGFFVDRAPVAWVLLAIWVGAGLAFAPFEWTRAFLPDAGVAVDALPNVGENQQIVWAEWPGQSPRDVEDQVTRPLTSALLGSGGVETVRSTSMLGLSLLFVVFDEGVPFEASRSRLLERLAALPPDALPPEVAPSLGPEATPLGQVYWYTLVGKDSDGKVVGGWSLRELRTLQDDRIRDALTSVPGVAEVASVGGYVPELQVDVDPDALAAADIGLLDVARAVQGASEDAGLRTMEINRVEYLLRSEGTASGPEEVRESVVTVRDGKPLRVEDLAHVHWGPALRRGALDDAGAETVGGVVVVQHGENPRRVLGGVRDRIERLAPSLPEKVLPDGTRTRVVIEPFYDRTELIDETIQTLSDALVHQLWIAVVVVVLLLQRLSAALLISALMPLGVLGAFVGMKALDIDAHIMALAGIAIAIGTMVDMGIVLVENIVRQLDTHRDEAGVSKGQLVARAAGEVAPAVITSSLTTLVSFLPIFALSAEEGRMFRPLAATKSLGVLAALLGAVVLLPALAGTLSRRVGLHRGRASGFLSRGVAGLATVGLASTWKPLGRGSGAVANGIFVVLVLATILFIVFLFIRFHSRFLDWSLRRPKSFLAIPAAGVLVGVFVGFGAERLLGWLPEPVHKTKGWVALTRAFPGLGTEYMPEFDEGSFLVMPTTTAHASFGQALDLLQTMDAAIAQIPEVDRVVGKLGRAETALDPAPVSMFETLVTYHPEWIEDPSGQRVRKWRDHIRSPEDIWAEIRQAAQLPGLTGVPKLQPIETRQVMLQSGMRSPLGLVVQGDDLDDVDRLARRLEALLREVPSIRAETVSADESAVKPYLELHFDRVALARHGLRIADMQERLRAGIGGRALTQTQEGRLRFDVRVRFMREERDTVGALERLRFRTPTGARIPLDSVADIRYRRGPSAIRSENGFVVSYVTFEGRPGMAPSRVVDEAKHVLARAENEGRLQVPDGARYRFGGRYASALRSQRQLAVLVPLALCVVFVILYLQFRSLAVVGIVVSGLFVAISGAFVALGLYGVEGFLAVEPFGISLRQVFGVEPIRLSTAVWVGIVALIGIATDDGVVLSTYLQTHAAADEPETESDIRQVALDAAQRRLRPCMMTTTTTFLALLPVISASGRGADLMRPMAVPILGGMVAELLTLITVPVLWVQWRKWSARRTNRVAREAQRRFRSK
jgi:copper/silver efflux system protein